MKIKYILVAESCSVHKNITAKEFYYKMIEFDEWSRYS